MTKNVKLFFTDVNIFVRWDFKLWDLKHSNILFALLIFDCLMVDGKDCNATHFKSRIFVFFCFFFYSFRSVTGDRESMKKQVMDSMLKVDCFYEKTPLGPLRRYFASKLVLLLPSDQRKNQKSQLHLLWFTKHQTPFPLRYGATT